MSDRCDDVAKRRAREVLDRLGVWQARLTLLGCGLSSTAWRVCDPATDRDLVLRVAVDCAAGSTYEREQVVLARILDTLDQAAPCALRVPRPIAGHWRLPSPHPVLFSVTERLDGSELAPRHATAAAEPIGRALRALHQVNTRSLRLPPTPRGWPFDATPVPSLFGFRLTRWAENIRQAAATQPGVLVHGDLHEQNILWPLADHPDGATVGLLDFGLASVGAGLWDFAARESSAANARAARSR